MLSFSFQQVHLRSGPGGFEDDSNLIEDLTPILKPREMELLLKSTNRPAHIMNCMTQIVKEAKLEGGALMCLGWGSARSSVCSFVGGVVECGVRL